MQNLILFIRNVCGLFSGLLFGDAFVIVRHYTENTFHIPLNNTESRNVYICSTVRFNMPIDSTRYISLLFMLLAFNRIYHKGMQFNPVDCAKYARCVCVYATNRKFLTLRGNEDAFLYTIALSVLII